MTHHLVKTAIATTFVCAFSLTGPFARADSTSSASSAASTSVGSSSTSLNTSSNSSSGKDRVAQGPYTVLAVADVAQQPHLLQLRLQSVAADGTAAREVTLTLPRVAAEREQLAVGHTVLAQHRPYGLAFATVDSGGQARPFFLVLDDSWHRELHNHPVGG